ncbi:2877_t:CDS:2 [Entrophospora sp. SA101]|nr:2877_t:CDS:2 [Entrophospora sp. SA101]
MNKINFSKITPQIGYYLAGFTDGEGTKKKNDFAKFRQIAELIARKDHLTKEGIKKVLELREQMNNGGKHKYSSTFIWKKLEKSPETIRQTEIDNNSDDIRLGLVTFDRLFPLNVNINLKNERSKGSEIPCQVGDCESQALAWEESLVGYHSNKRKILTSWFTAKRTVSGGYRNPMLSVKAQGCLTVRQTSRTDTKVGLNDPARPHRRKCLAPRCRLIASWRGRTFQGLGCSPIKAVRELGLERRETVWSLSVVGVGNLRRTALISLLIGGAFVIRKNSSPKSKNSLPQPNPNQPKPNNDLPLPNPNNPPNQPNNNSDQKILAKVIKEDLKSILSSVNKKNLYQSYWELPSSIIYITSGNDKEAEIEQEKREKNDRLNNNPQLFYYSSGGSIKRKGKTFEFKEFLGKRNGKDLHLYIAINHPVLTNIGNHLDKTKKERFYLITGLAEPTKFNNKYNYFEKFIDTTEKIILVPANS